jgi:hypothetical protein
MLPPDSEGLLLFTGQSIVYNTYLYIVNDNLLPLTGIGTFSDSYIYLPSGQLTYNGVSSCSNSYIYSTSGLLSVNNNNANFTIGHLFYPNGQLTFNGIANIVYGYVCLSTNVFTLNQTGVFSATYQYLSNVCLLMDGIGVIWDVFGLFPVTGVALLRCTYVYDMSGGLLQANGIAFVQEGFLFFTQGKLIFNGISTYRVTTIYSTHGRVLRFLGISLMSGTKVNTPLPITPYMLRTQSFQSRPRNVLPKKFLYDQNSAAKGRFAARNGAYLPDATSLPPVIE